ncbi:MAG: hypothetical protein HRF40_11465 [Nitrososphaera sp.]
MAVEGYFADNNGQIVVESTWARFCKKVAVQFLTWRLQLQLEWRRSKVLEYASQGFSQKEIAAKLQVDESTVSRDLAFLREQARNNIRHFIEERLPLEFEKCVTALNAVRRDAWIVAQQSTDGKLKIQALSLVKECASTTMELLTNSAIVDEAIRFIEEAAAATTKLTSQQQTTTVRAKADNSAFNSGSDNPHRPSRVEKGNDIQGASEKNSNISAGGTATTANKVF